ncbi:hypothetical protein CK203_026089 [Vitis vinifera]|uniref:Uncharacterized protein n=1 Tax=Vitis vinifera TaxID=29760 RepID=A0A438IJC5_VITVI|nr:hypothetical protein CK203_026089 [Vitis vinifera]
MLDTPTTESSAPVTMKPNSTLPNNNYGGSEGPNHQSTKMGYGVSIAKKPRHTKETCQKLHGKMQSFGRGMEIDMHNLDNRNGQAHIAQSKENSQPKSQLLMIQMLVRLNREEIERLCSLLTSMDKPTASCFLA